MKTACLSFLAVGRTSITMNRNKKGDLIYRKLSTALLVRNSYTKITTQRLHVMPLSKDEYQICTTFKDITLEEMARERRKNNIIVSAVRQEN